MVFLWVLSQELKGKRILDLGCGAGCDCYVFAKIQIQHALKTLLNKLTPYSI
jgi:ribosomal protein L11 methylase PrmA